MRVTRRTSPEPSRLASRGALPAAPPRGGPLAQKPAARNRGGGAGVFVDIVNVNVVNVDVYVTDKKGNRVTA